MFDSNSLFAELKTANITDSNASTWLIP